MVPRFFSVPALGIGKVVCRVGFKGSVWAWRVPSAGQHPSPACLFLPFARSSSARAVALVAGALGWSAVLKSGRSCACWASGPLANRAPVWALKISLPQGTSAKSARQQLRAAYLRLTW